MNLDQFQKDGKFLMLALDHRGSLKKLMNPQNPDSVSDEEVISLKKEIIKALEGEFSALLVDEVWGLEAYQEDHLKKPFLLPLEKSGYTDEAGERVTEIEFSAAELAKHGAAGTKVLFYFNPDGATATKQLETAKRVIEDSYNNNLPIFLEIVTYTSDGKDYTQDGEFIYRSVKAFLDFGALPDVFKLEYPGSLEGAQKITDFLGETPWILLTNPDSFDKFKAHLSDAIKAGAKGFLAGRAAWKEVCSMSGDEKAKFLSKTLPDRFSEFSKIAEGGE